MYTFAHLINPFRAPAGSDLERAQPITFASLQRAQAETKHSVELWACGFAEDKPIFPKVFSVTSPLTRSVADCQGFEMPLPLPIEADLLDRLYESSDAEYLIYSNVDIGVQPHFYEEVAQFIDAGHDAFIINRRRIPDRFFGLEDLEAMYQEKGRSHPGFDCFVFHRDLYRKFSLAEVCIGVPFAGIVLAQNVFAFAQNPKVFTDEFLTFHLGMEIYRKRAPREYFRYNQKQFWLAMSRIFDQLDSRKWPYGNQPLPLRMIRWGLHPSLPIRLALKLEKRRWFS